MKKTKRVSFLMATCKFKSLYSPRDSFFLLWNLVLHISFDISLLERKKIDKIFYGLKTCGQYKKSIFFKKKLTQKSKQCSRNWGRRWDRNYNWKSQFYSTEKISTVKLNLVRIKHSNHMFKLWRSNRLSSWLFI